MYLDHAKEISLCLYHILRTCPFYPLRSWPILEGTGCCTVLLSSCLFVSDIAIFGLKRDVKLQRTNSSCLFKYHISTLSHLLHYGVSLFIIIPAVLCILNGFVSWRLQKLTVWSTQNLENTAFRDFSRFSVILFSTIDCTTNVYKIVMKSMSIK